MNQFCKRVVESSIFNTASIGAILVAAIVVGMETSSAITSQFGSTLRIIDKVILAYFVVEIIIRFGATSPRYRDYFKDGWNIFDLIVVAVCLLPISGHYAAVIRLIRVLRVLRVIRVFPRLRIIVDALLKGMSSMAYIALLLTILFYIYGVIGVFLFGPNDALHFGSLPAAFLTLFQIVTLEGWVDVMREQMNGPQSYVAPFYFISFIVIGTMIVLNLFIGTIVGSMTEAQQEHKAELGIPEKAVVAGTPQNAVDSATSLKALEEQLDELRQKCAALRLGLEGKKT